MHVSNQIKLKCNYLNVIHITKHSRKFFSNMCGNFLGKSLNSSTYFSKIINKLLNKLRCNDKYWLGQIIIRHFARLHLKCYKSYLSQKLRNWN